MVLLARKTVLWIVCLINIQNTTCLFPQVVDKLASTKTSLVDGKLSVLQNTATIALDTSSSDALAKVTAETTPAKVSVEILPTIKGPTTTTTKAPTTTTTSKAPITTTTTKAPITTTTTKAPITTTTTKAPITTTTTKAPITTTTTKSPVKTCPPQQAPIQPNTTAATCIACKESSTCKRVPVLPTPLSVAVPTMSPIYEPVLQKRYDTIDLDSACNTFFKITDIMFLQVRSVVYKNCTGLIESFIINDVVRSPGVFRTQGRTNIIGLETARVSNEYAFTSSFVGCPPILALYKCYLFDLCQWQNPDTDFRFAISGTTNIPELCLKQIETNMNSNILLPSQYVRATYNFPLRCVVRIGNASCINADRVAKKDSIALPVDFF